MDERASCRVLASGFLKSSFSERCSFSGGYLLSLVLFTRAPSPPNSFFSYHFSFSLHSLTLLLSPIIRYSSLHIHPNYWRIACPYSLHSPYLLLTSYHLATHLRHHPKTLLSSTASTCSLFAVLYLEHMLSIAASTE